VGCVTDSDLVAIHDQWVRTIANVVSKGTGYKADADDLHSEGMIGLLGAARTFRPGGGANFKTYAYRRVRGQMLESIRRSCWVKRSALPRYRQSGTEPPKMLTGEPFEHKPDPADQPYVPAEQADSVRALLRHLSRQERFVVLSSVVLGLTLKDTGKAAGLSESRTSQIRTQALKSLRERLSGTIAAMSVPE
jgi:RNA polymerase sigma factor for flagellar operon FliA